MAAGVADGLLAFGVGPAGAVGDQLAVVADEQAADCLSAWSWLSGVHQPGADVVSEPEVAPRRLDVAGPRLTPARLVLCPCVSELIVVEAGAGEVSILTDRSCVALPKLFVGEVEHEGRVDDPDPGGEVLPALVHERIPPVAGAVTDLARDADLHRSGLGASGERVELAVESSSLQPRIAASCWRPSALRWPRACSICSAPSSIAPSSIRGTRDPGTGRPGVRRAAYDRAMRRLRACIFGLGAVLLASLARTAIDGPDLPVAVAATLTGLLLLAACGSGDTPPGSRTSSTAMTDRTDRRQIELVERWV